MLSLLQSFNINIKLPWRVVSSYSTRLNLTRAFESWSFSLKKSDKDAELQARKAIMINKTETQRRKARTKVHEPGVRVAEHPFF